MLTNPPAGTQRVTPRLAYADPSAALNFLYQAFGFPERRDMRLQGRHGSIIVAAIQIADAYVMIGPAGSHDIVSPAATAGPTAGLLVYVDDIDAHYQQARDHGANIISPPADQYWGDRRYEAADSEGHLWFFHQRTQHVSQEQIAAIEATFSEDK